jgi:hypothetical protein
MPGRLNGVALSVGAGVPDLVEVLVWPFRAGELGQGVGHSLIGVVVLCIPVGLAVTWIVRRGVPSRMLARLDDGSPGGGVSRDVFSLGVGALSHVLFDLVTHCNFVLFWPWLTDAQPFPAWFCRAWAHVPLLVYRKPYPLAPHTILWFVLSVLGAVLFFRSLSPKNR